MIAKGSEEPENFRIGISDVKKFFQWILGCTYEKKTMRKRIAEMFHFAEAPHIVVYERAEDRPWYWIVGIVTAVLVAVLSLYYTLEAGIRYIRKLMLSAVPEPPHSTVTTPRCLSPIATSKKDSPKTPLQKQESESIRQKVSMNEPVNCVFIRPAATPKSVPITVPTLNSEEDVVVVEEQKQKEKEKPKKSEDVVVKPESSEEKKTKKETKSEEKSPKKREKKKSTPPMRLDEVQFDASSNFNIRPTMVSSPNIQPDNAQSSNRKSSGAEEEKPPTTSISHSDRVNEWVMKQIAGCMTLETERSTAGGGCGESEISETFEIERENSTAPSKNMMEKIQELITAHLENMEISSSDENLSEMSMVTGESLEFSHFSEILENSGISPVENLGKETIGDEEEADIVIDDSYLLADMEDECDGSILVKNGPQKVLFRWTDRNPETIDSVTITGTFFGWKMNIPMRRSGEKTFEVCVELPEGMHDYLITVFRFD